MFSFLRKHHRLVMGFMAACIVGLLLFGIGGGSLQPSPYDAVLKVNKTKITQADYNHVYQQIVRQRGALTPDQQKQAEAEAIQELIRQEVFYQEANKFGIQVPDQDLQMYLASYTAFQTDGKFDIQKYAQTIQQVVGMPLDQFEKIRKKDIAGQKLTRIINSAIHITDEEVNEGLPMRLAVETDKKKKDEIMKNPKIFRDELRNRQANQVFQDWLGHVNSTLKVVPVSAAMKKRLSPAG